MSFTSSLWKLLSICTSPATRRLGGPRRRTRLGLAVLVALLMAPAAAWGGIIVNIGGTESGFLPGDQPFVGQSITNLVGALNQLTLDAGTYTITNATGLPGANPDFTAWRFNGGSNWVWNYVIADNASSTVLLYEYAGLENGTGIWSSQAQVAAQPSVQNYSRTLTLAAPTTLNFMVVDYFLNDNLGGVALHIESASTAAAVPEPSSIALFSLGVAAMAGYSRLRRRDRQKLCQESGIRCNADS